MVDRLSGLVTEVHKSGIQVNTSVERNCRHSPAAARHGDRNCRDHDRNRCHVERDCRHVEGAREDDHGSGRRRGPVGHARRKRSGRFDAHGEHHAPCHGGRGLHQRQAFRAERKGREHQPGRHDHHEGCRPDEPAFLERRYRSRKGRRIRPRVCGRGDRDSPSGRSDSGCELRHRADGQGDPDRPSRPV